MFTKKEYEVAPSVQVIIAVWNEEKGVGPTIAELKQYLHSSKVLVVDGGSVDRTVEVAKNMGAEIVFQDGTGKGDAIAKAIQWRTWMLITLLSLMLITRTRQNLFPK